MTEEIKCHCGFTIVTGVQVAAISGVCPSCGEPFTWPQCGLEINNSALGEIAHSLQIIREHGGFGTLIVKFQKGRARFVGLGESLLDTWCGR